VRQAHRARRIHRRAGFAPHRHCLHPPPLRTSSRSPFFTSSRGPFLPSSTSPFLSSSLYITSSFFARAPLLGSSFLYITSPPHRGSLAPGSPCLLFTRPFLDITSSFLTSSRSTFLDFASPFTREGRGGNGAGGGALRGPRSQRSSND